MNKLEFDCLTGFDVFSGQVALSKSMFIFAAMTVSCDIHGILQVLKLGVLSLAPLLLWLLGQNLFPSGNQRNFLVRSAPFIVIL